MWEKYLILLVPLMYLFLILCLTWVLIQKKIKISLEKWVAFGCGVLVVLVMYDLLPHIFELPDLSWQLGLSLLLGGFLLNGVAEVFILPRIKVLNRFLPSQTHQCREHDSHHIHHYHLLPSSVGCSVVACFILCAFFDGIRLSASLFMGTEAGLTAAFALLCHLLPESVTVIGMALSSGLGSVLVGIVLLYGLALLGGSFIYVLVSDFSHFEIWLLPVATGLFIYVALVHLIPVVFKTRQIKTCTLGAGFCFLLFYSLKEVHHLFH